MLQALINRRRLWLGLALLTLALGVTVALRAPQVANARQKDPVTAAWEKARATGSYHFTSDVVQVTMPTAKVTNVGRSSRSEELHLEGQSDLRRQTVEMQIWSGGGSVLQAGSSTGIKVADGKTFVREGQGEWQEKPDFSVDGLAPQGDFFAYLVALRNVQAHAPEQRGSIHFTRYSFTLDGPTFAAYVHEQMERTLRAKGELPPGTQLEVPRYYQEMTGDGELWIGADGLPLRQILRLQFPPQKDEQVQAQLVVDFSHYGTPLLSGWAMLRAGDLAGLWVRLPALPATLVTYLPPTLLLLTALLGLGLVLYYRRRRLLETALTIAVITSLVVGPVLTTMLNVRFFDAQTAKAAGQAEQQAAVEQDRDLRAALGKVEFDPHRNPLEIERLKDREIVNESPNLAIAQSPNLQAAPPTDSTLDTDGDGLSNFVEQRVGTNELTLDTDADGLTDNQELRGFSFGGKTWYLNALGLDSNGDGQADGIEWGLNADGTARSTPQDTDNDQLPDLFDPDNDNDGASDNKDLAPFVAGATTFDENNPLQLRLNNLTAGKPTVVEFQLRPQDPKHLWFAFNVLDWPQDGDGQMQDIDGFTYADYARSRGRVAEANEANGDMKLVPMLEIRLPSAGANLPAQADLTPFNINVRDVTADGQSKVVYVPINVVKDERTGQRVAFSGQMRYQPTGAWPNAHSVRLAWVVQNLVDLPCDPKNPTAVAAGCQADGFIRNVPQPVHSYYDRWTLTGLTVREDHGSTMDIAYEDPDVDPNKRDDAALMALSFVLDHHFVIARDSNNDGRRDLTVDEIANRFDRTRNSGYSEDQRFAVPNILRVEKQSYPTLEGAVASTAMTETQKVLAKFVAASTADRNVKPLLFFAQESSARMVTLDALRAGGGSVVQSGANLTLDMAPAGQPAQTVDVTASIKWSAFCGSAATPLTWQVCSGDEYWEELERRYGALAPLPTDESPDWVGGRLQLAQLYYTGLTNGYYTVVQRGVTVSSYSYSLDGESTTTTNVRASLQGLATLPIEVGLAFERSLRLWLNVGSLKGPLYEFGATLRDNFRKAQTQLAAFKPGTSGYKAALQGVASAKLGIFKFYNSPIAMAGAVFTAISQIVSLSPDIPLTTRTVVGALSLISNLTLNVVVTGIEIGLAIKAGAFTLRGVLSTVAQVSKGIKVGGAVGLAISVTLTWSFFIYAAAESGASVGSPELNKAFFEAVAATLLAVFLFVLSISVVGLLVVLIVAVIDGLLTLICELGVDELRNAPGLGGACFTLNTAAVKGIAYFLYNYDLMIDLARQDLLVTGAPAITLVDPDVGYRVGNAVNVTLPVTTTVVHKDPDSSIGIYINLFLYLFSQANLKSSTFRYSLTHPVGASLTVARDQMTGEWQGVREDHKYVLTPMYRGSVASQISKSAIPLAAAGVNRPVEFYLNYGYAVPAYECVGIPNILPPWTPPVIPLCYVREATGSDSPKIDDVKFDVFPATLDAFMTLTNKEGGLGLGWDPIFPALLDADGDGLRAGGQGGLDPADNNADSDSDGLSDTFELEMQVNGTAYSPILRDTDLDGLTDSQEAIYNSDPAIADTDNDGLTDGQEVWHSRYDSNGNPTTLFEGGWDVRINATSPFVVRVSSDPSAADSDQDGLSDLAEKQLAEATCTTQEVANGRTCEGNPLKPVDSQNRPFHPNVPNTPPLALLLAHNDFDGFLAPGQTLRYTTTVIATAPLPPGVLNVLPPLPPFTTQPPAVALPFDPLTFSGSQTVTVPSNLTVQSGVATQKVVVTSQVRTRLPSSSGPDWVFDPVTPEAALAGFTAPLLARNTSLTANRLDRTDSYLLSSLLSASPTAGGAGDVQAYNLPNGANRALEADNLNKNIFRGASPPRSATNNRGDSLVVWDQVENCRTLNITLLTIVTAGPDHGTSGIEPFITVRDSVSNQDVTVWSWTNVIPVDLQAGTYRQGFPVTVNVCGNYTIRMQEADGDTAESLGAITLTQDQGLNSTATFEGAGHKIAIDVNSPYRDDYTVAGALVGADGAVKQRLTFSPPALDLLAGLKRRSFNPVVATNGADFLVVYETRLSQNGGLSYNVSQSVAADGAIGSPTAVSTNGLSDTLNPSTPFDTQSRTAFALTWMDRFYRLVFQPEVSGTKLWRRDYLPSGVPANNQTAELSNNSQTSQPSFATSWDPISGRWALAYIPTGTTSVRINRYPNVASFASDAGIDFLSPYKQVDLDWNVQNGGWLFQGQLTDNRQVFVALDADLTQRAGNATQISWTGADKAGLALACPAVTAVPVLDLRMEELPGATSFVDSAASPARPGNNAICGSASQCPAAGAPGGTYTNGTAIGGGVQGPASDYALTFNSNQYLRVPNNATLAFDAARSFTWLTWVKTAVGTPIMRKGLDGANDLLLSITPDSGRLRMGFGNINTNTLTAAGPDLRDNQWHQVAVTLDRITNSATLYVDGTARGSGTFTGSFVTTDDLFIGSGNFAGYNGALDNLRIYHSALGADTISALYNRTLQAYCVGSSPTQSGNGVQWAKLVVRQPDRRGGAIIVNNSVNLTVDNDQPTASLTSLVNNQTVQGGSSSAPRIVVIGGKASDPTSGINQVEVSVNNGPWQVATGAESWSFALPLADGVYQIRTRATDAVGNIQSTLATTTFYADGTAPQIQFASPNSARRAFRGLNGGYAVTLAGTTQDVLRPGAAGVAAATVQLFNQQGQALSEPQAAELTDVGLNNVHTWLVTYRFPMSEGTPNGPYLLEMQTTDAVGNQFKQRLANPVIIDGLAPVALLKQTAVSSGALTNIITNTVTIGGLITETFQVSSADVNFTPLQQTLPYVDSVLRLNLDDSYQPGQLPEMFVDSSPQANHARCSSLAQCPFNGLPGRLNRAIQLDGGRYLRVPNHPTLNFDTSSSFSWQAWVKTNATPTSNPIMRKGLSGTADLMLSINSSGQAEMGFGTLTGASRLFAGPALRDDQWHQIILTFSRPSNRAELYVDGVSYGGGGFPGNYTTPDDLLIGSNNSVGYQGQLDQIAIFRHALSAAEVQALYQAASRQAYPATITGNSWTRQLPAGLEGIYQIDLPTSDGVGNRLENGNLWRGVIDVVAPRVTLTGRATGQSYLDTATNTQRYEIAYTCRAADFQLNEASFTCAGNAQRPAAKTFNNDPLLKQQFPDLTLLTTLVNTYTVWAASPTPTGSLTACDAYGHCTTANVATATGAAAGVVSGTVDSGTVSSAAVTAGGPQTAILAPTAGSVVNGTGAVQVSVAAQADQPLKEIVILLDNTPVSTIAFAQRDDIKRTVQTAAVTVANAGTHTLAARATDWNGVQSQPVPVSFVVDRQAPTVVLSNSQLTKEDSYGAQTNILRFRGTASDDTGLVAVQLKVGDGVYADATFGGGAWQIAYPVTDPEGKQLAVKVRAIDAAGNVSEISQTLGSDLSVVDAPDTTLGDKPADPSSSTNASFTFSGSATAVAFECQLDDAPAVPCSSPWPLSDLSNGAHTFKVAALNAQGFPDLTPASHTWTVNVTTLATTLTAKPEAETISRTASFSFAASGASSFQCALDGGAYAACASPKNYDKLGNGNHTFLVRAVGGPASRHVWRVTNAAPTVTGDQVLMVVENSAVKVTLQGTDSDALTYQIVDQPQHGFLLGLAPNLTYVPNTGYAGPDRFTYRAWDGEAASATATVHITVRLGKYAVFAQEGVAFEQNSALVRGDVGVNVKSAGPFLRNNVEASFSQNSLMQDPASRVLADSIVVDNNGVIYNPSYNDLTGKGTVNGTRTTPLALPLRSALPALPTITPGTQAVNVTGNQTLAAGSYGALSVGNGATLVLSGGLYHFASWTVSQNAKVHFQAPSEVRIAGALVVNNNAFVGPAPGVTNLDANSIVIHIAGTDGQSGPGNQPRAAAFDQNVVVTAYVVAPNGLINFRQNVNATGAFIGKWVLAEQNAKVSRPGDPVVRAADLNSNAAETAIITTPGITTTVETTTVVDTVVSVTLNALFLPLVNVDTVAAGDAGTQAPVVSETMVSDTVVLETAPVLTPTLPVSTTPVLTTTTAVTTTVITSTVSVTPTAAAAPGTIYLPLVTSATP